MGFVTCLSCGRRFEGTPSNHCLDCGGAVIRAEAFDKISGLDQSEVPEKRGAIKPGEYFLRYHVDKILGEGAQGIVYLVDDPQLNRTVALKTLKPELFASQQLVTRFHREAELAGRVRHPFIATIYDYGIHQGIPYYTMEYMKGRTLETFINEKGHVPIRMAMKIAEFLGMALHHAHKESVIHRDIKPANILISATGDTSIIMMGESPGTLRVLVTDFGIAHDEMAQTRLTASGAMIGTPLYMAPEQIDQQLGKVDARTDQYALGTILYEMITGSPPFQEDSIAKLFLKITTESPVPMKKKVPAVFPDLETIVEKILQKEQDRRYRDCGAVVEDLQRASRGDPILARPTSIGERVFRKAKKNKTAVFAGMIAILVSVIFFGVVLWNMGEADRQKLKEYRLEAAFRIKIERDLSNWVKKAEAAFAAGDVESAQKLCLQTLKVSNQVKDRPPPPDPYRSRPELGILSRPLKLPKTETHFLLSRIHIHRGDEVSAMADLVKAYHCGMTERPDPNPLTPKILLTLGQQFGGKDEWDRSIGAYKALRRQFPDTKESAEAAASLFDTYAKTGDVKSAWKWGNQALHENRNLPVDQKSALARNMNLYKLFVPKRTLSRPAKAWTLVDVSGTGELSLLWIDKNANLIRTNLHNGFDEKHPFFPGADIQKGTSSLWPVDINSDGISEIVLFRGSALEGKGEMYLFEWDKKPVLLFKMKIRAEGNRCWATSGDLTGDGIVELAMGLGYFQRELLIGQVSGDKFSLTDRIGISSDPLAGLMIDMDEHGRKGLLFSTGGWNENTGYRIYFLQWEGPGKKEISEVLQKKSYVKKLMQFRNDLYLLNSPPKKHYVPMETVSRTSGVLKKGTFRVSRSGITFSLPIPETYLPIEDRRGGLLNNNSLLIKKTDQILIHGEDGGEITLGSSNGDWFLSQMDKDNFPEPIQVYRFGGKLHLTLYGEGTSPGEDFPDSAGRSSDHRDPLLAAVEELYSLGFFQESLGLINESLKTDTPSDIQGWLSYRAAQCHIELGEREKALLQFEAAAKVYPPLNREVSLAEIDLLESSEWWPELVEKLERFLQTGTLSPSFRNTLEKRLKGAKTMKSLIISTSLKNTPLLSDDPFLLKMISDSEWEWNAPTLQPVHHYLPVPSPTGSFQFYSQFVVEEPGWEREFEFSLVRLEKIDPIRISELDTLRMKFRFSGSGDRPTARISIQSNHSLSGNRRWYQEGIDCAPGDRWVFDIKHIEHLRLLTITLITPNGDPIRFEWDHTNPFPKGNYALLLRSAEQFGKRDFQRTSLRIEKYFYSQIPGTRPLEWKQNSPQGNLQRWQGEWIREGGINPRKELEALLSIENPTKENELPPGNLFFKQKVNFYLGLIHKSAPHLETAVLKAPGRFLDWFSSRYILFSKETLTWIRNVLESLVNGKFIQSILKEMGEMSPPPPSFPQIQDQIRALLEAGEDHKAIYLLVSRIWSSPFADTVEEHGS